MSRFYPLLKLTLPLLDPVRTCSVGVRFGVRPLNSFIQFFAYAAGASGGRGSRQPREHCLVGVRTENSSFARCVVKAASFRLWAPPPLFPFLFDPSVRLTTIVFMVQVSANAHTQSLITQATPDVPLDGDPCRLTLNLMQPMRRLPSAFRLLRVKALLLLCAGAWAWPAGQAGQFGVPMLAFTEPLGGQIYMAASNVPIVLRAFAPDDVFLSAEVFADGGLIGVATFCCALCPCAHPLPGMETVLQIPTPWNDGRPPAQVWQGWTNTPDGLHRLTARAVGENGTTVESPPVMISVREMRLFIGPNAEQKGAYVLAIPNGALLDEGSIDLEVSSDLRTWERLGPFSPGNVSAFYWDAPPVSARERRFYRAVWVPQIPR